MSGVFCKRDRVQDTQEQIDLCLECRLPECVNCAAKKRRALKVQLPEKEIVAAYMAGKTAKALADEYGVNYTTMDSRLRLWGAKI